MKKQPNKIEPCIVSSREAMQSTVGDVVRAKLELAELRVQMEQEIAEIQKRFEPRYDELGREIAIKEAGVYVWAKQHREEFGDRKSIDLTLATVGFRTTPPRVEKLRSRDTWGAIAQRMMSIHLEPNAEAEDPGFDGESYIRYGDPETDKEKLLRDRAVIPKDVLDTIGIRFERDELFFIEPKSAVLEGSRQEAA